MYECIHINTYVIIHNYVIEYIHRYIWCAHINTHTYYVTGFAKGSYMHKYKYLEFSIQYISRMNRVACIFFSTAIQGNLLCLLYIG